MSENNTENLPVTVDAEVLPSVTDNSMYLDMAKFEHLQRVAKLFASSRLVPEQYRNNPADCTIALQMSFRLGIEPMMFMQNSYVVHGRPGIEAKLVIAMVNAKKIYRHGIEFEYSGEGDKRQCTAYGTRVDTGKVNSCTVSIDIAKKEGWFSKSGSKWQTMPDQMLAYRSASWLARLYCPEVIMGMQTVEELSDITPVRESLTSGSAADLTKALAEPEQRVEIVNTTTGEVTEAVVKNAAEPEVQPKQEEKPAAPKQQSLGGLSRIKQHASKQ